MIDLEMERLVKNLIPSSVGSNSTTELLRDVSVAKGIAGRAELATRRAVSLNTSSCVG
jgi:hypothetical protein